MNEDKVLVKRVTKTEMDVLHGHLGVRCFAELRGGKHVAYFIDAAKVPSSPSQQSTKRTRVVNGSPMSPSAKLRWVKGKGLGEFRGKLLAIAERCQQLAEQPTRRDELTGILAEDAALEVTLNTLSARISTLVSRGYLEKV